MNTEEEQRDLTLVKSSLYRLDSINFEKLSLKEVMTSETAVITLSKILSLIQLRRTMISIIELSSSYSSYRLSDSISHYFIVTVELKYTDLVERDYEKAHQSLVSDL